MKILKRVPNLSSDCYMSVVGLVQFAEFSPGEATHWLHVWTSSLGVVRSTARCKWLVSVSRHSRFLSTNTVLQPGLMIDDAQICSPDHNIILPHHGTTLDLFIRHFLCCIAHAL